MPPLTDPTAFAPVFAQQLAERATGALEVRAEKKRWLFYFEEGALISTRSNLKSESLETIQKQKPDLEGDRLLLFQAIRRVKNAIASGVAPRVVAGAAPKERAAADGASALVRGLMSACEEADLDALIADHLDAPVRLAGDLSDAGGSRKLARHVDARADGQAPLSALLDGAPGRRAEALAALWLALQLGILTTAKADAAATDRDGDAPAAPAAPTGGLDFSSLIAGSMGDAPDTPDEPEAAAPSPASEPAPAPFAPAAEGPSLSIDDDDEDEDEDEDEAPLAPPPQVGGPGSPLGIDDAAPTPGEAIQIEAVSVDTPVETRTSGFSFPSFQQAAAPEAAPEAAPADDPRTRELRLLAERVQMAETHFDVLDVAWDADTEEFRTAHLDLARRLHPDAFAGTGPEVEDLASEAFDKVRAAWEVLGDDEKRRAYIDKVIHGKKTEEELAMEQVEAYWAAESEFKRGLALFNNGRTSQAHDHFAAAVEKVPDELEFKAYWAFTSFQRVKADDPEKAEEFKELLKDVLDRNKEQERKLDTAWVLMGRIYRDLANDKAAKRCFVQALKLNAANGDAQRELRRLSGAAPGGGAKKKEDPKKGEDKKGFFGRLFGGKK